MEPRERWALYSTCSEGAWFSRGRVWGWSCGRGFDASCCWEGVGATKGEGSVRDTRLGEGTDWQGRGLDRVELGVWLSQTTPLEGEARPDSTLKN